MIKNLKFVVVAGKEKNKEVSNADANALLSQLVGDKTFTSTKNETKKKVTITSIGDGIVNAEVTENGKTTTMKNIDLKTDEGRKKLETFVGKDVFREFVDWIQQAYEDNIRKVLGSKISKTKNPSPVKIADDVKKANRFSEEGEKASTDVAKEYSPLKTKAKKEKGGETKEDGF